jgi:hypothetical protein
MDMQEEQDGKGVVLDNPPSDPAFDLVPDQCIGQKRYR